ncbi:FkbM family methyltransferase [Burkholderia pyrrocinia]|uniref:FkbM family methyltransferase n=1 Tax=Burkholderia pyrrocinia TaxID=60550 RepID=UPI00158D0276|nr:FkbM family methyltransferase [Burkholderia pyrrocinia]
MRKNLRSGVDVESAFASMPKRSEAPVPNVASGGDHRPSSPSGDNIGVSSPPGSPGTTQTIKRLTRPLARIVFKLLKPILRPLAFRIRRYLSEPLQHDVREEIYRSTTANLHKLEEVRHLVHQDVLASQLTTHKELQKTTANMMQELQKVQTSLQRDVLTAQLAANAEIRRAAEATAHTQREQLAALVANINARLDRIELYSYAAARRIAVNCGSDAVLVRTEAGFVLCDANDHALLACLVDTGELERGTRLLIEKFLKPGDCFIDVGANIGMHTLAAARAMGGRGKIIAFEPFGPTKQLLERTIWLNGFSSIVDVHQAAVSNEAGHHKLFLGATSGHHSIFPLVDGARTDATPVEVPLVMLNDVVSATQKVQLLKVDVEGAELQVLESAASIIESNPDLAIIAEFGPAHLERTGVAPTDWLGAFAQHGMQYRAINSLSGALEHWELDQLLSCDSINLLFSRKDSTVWGKLDT